MQPEPMRKPEELMIHEPNGGWRVVPIEGAISLGRATTNTLSYPEDNGLSRQHLIIERAGSEIVLRDLGSKNGTEVNQQRVTGVSVLHPGDRIKAGRITIEYRSGVDTRDRTVMFIDTPTAGKSSEMTFATNLEAAIEKQATAGSTSPGRIDALIRAGKELAAHRPLQDLFPLILDLSIQAVQASRGVLLTYSGGELVAQAARGDDFEISAAVRDQVLVERRSLLEVDAMSDANFGARQSIVLQGVRSFIAVPLQTGDEVIGLLYVDLTNATRSFTQEDLNLLTVMANIAAIRIQHAHLIELEAAERIYARESAQAAEIQQALLPRSAPEMAGLELAGYNLPCGAVGGDYFDYLPYGEKKLALLVGDVAGKGMPAALLMAGLQAHAQALTEAGGDDVGALVGSLNKAVKRRSPGNRFITLFFAVFDPDASTLTYCNAGHNPPLLLRADGSVSKLEEGGLALGMFVGLPYQSKTVSFEAGDLLVLYSDGVVEACPPGSEEEFGEERLLQLATSNAAAGLPAVMNGVMDELRAWSGFGGFADDVTLVLARRSLPA